MGFLPNHEGTLKVVNCRIITVEIVQKNKKYTIGGITNQQRLTPVAKAKLRQIRKNADTPTLETICKSLIKPIFLYNSEIWSLTKAREKNVDIMHQKFKRKPLSVRYSWDTLQDSHPKTQFKDVSIKHQLDEANWSKVADWHRRSSLRLMWRRTISTQMTRKHASHWVKKCKRPIWLNEQCPRSHLLIRW